MLNYTTLSIANKRSFIYLNIQVVISIIGTIGNVLTCMVFRRKRLKNTSYSMYFCIMLSCEIIGLVYALRYWARFFLNFDYRLVSPFFCKSDKFVTFSAGIAADWLLTVILADRLLTIVFHNRIKLIKKKFFQKTTIALVLVYSMSINLILLFKSNYEKINLEESNSTSFISIIKCTLDPKHRRNEQVTVLGNFIVSIVLNAIMHTVLIVFIFKSRRKITNRTNLLWIKDVKFAISTVALAIFELICKIFFGLIVGGSSILQTKISADEYQAYFYMSLNSITLSYGATFFFNIFFNSIFYEEFIGMFRTRRNSSFSIRTVYDTHQPLRN